MQATRSTCAAERIAGSANTIDSEQGVVPSGTSWATAITIAGYPSEAAIIRPPQSGNGFGIRLTTSAPHYLIFQDLVIDMVEQAGQPETAPSGMYLSGGANHNRFLRLEIKNNVNFGLVFSPNNGNSPFNEVLDCNIHDNGRAGSAATVGHGLYVSTSDNLFEGNDVHDNQGYGMHLFDNAGPMYVTRNTVRKNRIHDNGRNSRTVYGIVVAWGDANLIDGNLVYGNPGGIQVYPSSSHTDVRNNTVYGNSPLEGIAILQYAQDTVVSNNVVYGNGTDILDLGTRTTVSNNRSSP